MMCLVLWTIAGIVHPVAIRVAGGTLAIPEMTHFFGSLIICGLIAVAYPILRSDVFRRAVTVPGIASG